MGFLRSLARGDASIGERAATALVVVSGVSAAFIAFFARSLTDAGLAASAVVFFRFIATSLITAPGIALSREKRSATIWAFGAGLAVGLGWITYVLAIERLDVASVGAIYMTYPVFALVAGWGLFGVRPALRGVVGATMVLLGAAVAVGLSGVTSDGGAVLLALAAPVSFGLVVAVLSERVDVLRPFERIAATSMGAMVGLIPVVAAQPFDSVIPADGRTWALVLGVGLLTSLIPMGSFVIGAPVVGSARAAIAGGVELPTVFVIAWLLLGEPPTFAQLVGGAIIVAAVVVSPTRPPPIATARPRVRSRRRQRVEAAGSRMNVE
ncbi:MAG: DMT family transporter [Actinomycetota bacterium]